jgi:hypothetical protein
MKPIFIKSFLLAGGLSFFFLGESFAQKIPDCVKVAKSHRPNWLLISSAKLNNFYRNFSGQATFGNMKIVKTDQAYYLLGQEQTSKHIFAFELTQKGKRLFLDRKNIVHSCDQGDLSLDTFLHQEGKITGCKLGNHTIRQMDN